MLYMPVSTAAAPVVLSDRNVSVPLQASSQYYLLQSASVVPGVPVLNTTYVYPRYGFIPKPVESSVTKEEIEKPQTTQNVEGPAVQHVVHHHFRPSGQTCPGYCELCCPWNYPPTSTHHERLSRRDEFELEMNKYEEESIEERIERIRRELGEQTSTHHIVHHIHNCPTERAPSPPPAPRQPWRPTNQNEYPWRDAHLPVYRSIASSASQTTTEQHETAHERSHRNTRGKKSCCNGNDYVYRPKSEVEAQKWYRTTTGKDPQQEVHQRLYPNNNQTHANASTTTGSNHYFRTTHVDRPFSVAGERLTKVDGTYHHDVYSSGNSELHVIPRQGIPSSTPQVKILNSPVTYIH